MIMGRQMDAKDFAQMVIDNFDEILLQSLVMAVALYPYIIGQPYRLRHLRRALQHIANHHSTTATFGLQRLGRLLTRWISCLLCNPDGCTAEWVFVAICILRRASTVHYQKVAGREQRNQRVVPGAPGVIYPLAKRGSKAADVRKIRHQSGLGHHYQEW